VNPGKQGAAEAEADAKAERGAWELTLFAAAPGAEVVALGDDFKGAPALALPAAAKAALGRAIVRCQALARGLFARRVLLAAAKAEAAQRWGAERAAALAALKEARRLEAEAGVKKLLQASSPPRADRGNFTNGKTASLTLK
jgi:hypothetical protein